MVSTLRRAAAALRRDMPASVTGRLLAHYREAARHHPGRAFSLVVAGAAGGFLMLAGLWQTAFTMRDLLVRAAVLLLGLASVAWVWRSRVS